MNYMLRRTILEDRWQAQLTELIALCRSAGIEEVLLMEESHQLLMVPFPLEKHRRMAAIYAQMAEELRRAGIIFSINLAALVGHSDASVADYLVLPFQKFVGSDLREAHACYCILDEQWQAYAAEVCALYAAGKPDKMFVDDDFRSLGHTTLFGCFCPLHVRQTAQALGLVKLTAQQLLKQVCGTTEEDRRVRVAWMEINFAGQMQAARKMREATERVSPQTRLGLMNSGERFHALQGRDMQRLLREFSGPAHRPVSRPCGACYAEALQEDIWIMPQFMSLSMSAAGPDVQTVSEVDNGPHTRYTKSLFFTRFQMELHTLAGADDITLNIYDVLGTPFAQEPGFARLLAEMKGRLEIVRQARLGKTPKGFALPWHKDCAKHRINRSGRMDDLIPNRELDLLLPRMGIPTQFAAGPANAILGDDILCYSEAEVREFLKGGLLLDGVALEHLEQRGLGRLLGCSSAGPLRHGTVERMEKGEFGGPFADNLIATNWYCQDPLENYARRLAPAAGAMEPTSLLDLELKKRLGPGLVLFENELGGRVAVLAVPPGKWQWLYRSRAYLIIRVIQWLMQGSLPVWVDDCPNVGPFYYEDPQSGAGLLGLVSASLDPVQVTLRTNLRLKDLFTGAEVTPDNPIRFEGLGVRFFVAG